MRNYLKLASVAGLATAAPAFAQSTGVDYTGITDAVDVASTVTAIVAVGGIVALIAVARMGVRKVLGMIR